MTIYLCNGAAAPLVLLLLAGGAAMPSGRSLPKIARYVKGRGFM